MEEVTAEELGGADVHAKTSGVVDHYAEDDYHALALARDCLKRGKVLEGASLEARQVRKPCYDANELYGLIPPDLRQPFDVRDEVWVSEVLNGTLVKAHGNLWTVQLQEQ